MDDDLTKEALTDGDVKWAVLGVRVTLPQHEAMQAIAKSEGVSVSDILRPAVMQLILDHAPRLRREHHQLRAKADRLLDAVRRGAERILASVEAGRKVARADSHRFLRAVVTVAAVLGVRKHG